MPTLQTRPAPLADDLEDAALVAHVLAGRRDAFEAIMRRYNRRLFRLARSVLQHDAEAEDALQEAYLRAFQHLGGFRGEAGLGAWLSRIVLNEALLHRRRQRARPVHEALDTVAEPTTVVPFPGPFRDQPEPDAARAELRRLMEREIDRLPEEFRTVFMLHEVEQLKVREIAQALGLPEATVKTRNHRAKRLLRQELREHLDALTGETFPFLGARCDRVVAGVLARLPVIPAPGHGPPG